MFKVGDKVRVRKDLNVKELTDKYHGASGTHFGALMAHHLDEVFTVGRGENGWVAGEIGCAGAGVWSWREEWLEKVE